jgi:hypothetical protein
MKNEEDMGVESLEQIFFKKFEANYHSSCSCVLCIPFLLLTLKGRL